MSLFLTQDYGDAVIIDDVPYKKNEFVMQAANASPDDEDTINIAAQSFSNDKTAPFQASWTAEQVAVARLTVNSGTMNVETGNNYAFFTAPSAGELRIWSSSVNGAGVYKNQVYTNWAPNQSFAASNAIRMVAGDIAGFSSDVAPVWANGVDRDATMFWYFSPDSY